MIRAEAKSAAAERTARLSAKATAEAAANRMGCAGFGELEEKEAAEEDNEAKMAQSAEEAEEGEGERVGGDEWKACAGSSEGRAGSEAAAVCQAQGPVHGETKDQVQGEAKDESARQVKPEAKEGGSEAGGHRRSLLGDLPPLRGRGVGLKSPLAALAPETVSASAPATAAAATAAAATAAVGQALSSSRRTPTTPPTAGRKVRERAPRGPSQGSPWSPAAYAVSSAPRSVCCAINGHVSNNRRKLL